MLSRRRRFIRRNLRMASSGLMNRIAALLLLSLTVLPAGAREPGRDARPDPPPPLPEGVELAALITDSRLSEISGLALSRRHPDIFWMHNDSHDANALYGVDRQGRIQATLQLPVPNVDWEDISSFEHGGQSWLLVADTGDNGGVRTELALHLLPEPDTLDDYPIAADAVRTIRFRWPDGARDCEAVAVDVQHGAIYLIGKKRKPPDLFRLPLWPQENQPSDALHEAERIGTLAGIVQPTAEDLARSPVYGRYRSQITAADISADGRLFAVMSYLHVYLWPRHRDGWGAALAQPPQQRELPWMAQAEAMGFDAQDRALWLSSERLPAPLIRMDLSVQP